jgi:hypothetical protein
MPPANPEPARSPLPRRSDESLDRTASPALEALPPFFAPWSDEPVEQALACLSPTEERRLSWLLRKLERHLENLLARHENGVDENAGEVSPRTARWEERS